MPNPTFQPDAAFMRLALREAREHLAAIDGGPFGACIVRGEEVLAVAHNTVLKENDPTCHAEITAIRLASRRLGNYDLSGCVIYSTTEPCPMCFAAIHWACLAHLVYGTAISDVAALGFNELTISNEQMRAAGRSPVNIYPGFLVEECRDLLRQWLATPGHRVY
ncbi:MAG: nucleoside deaminase [Deltaproteobacteria bacterium]|nr:nucleoside deaminase [Deltaproteobacteria bacterium]